MESKYIFDLLAEILQKAAVLSFAEDRVQNIILGVRVQFEQWGN